MCNLALTLVAVATIGNTQPISPKGELVTLTMTERAGVARHGEWVTIGVPLPKGAVKSTQELALLRNGRALAAEILPVTKWWEDGTLRWVHLIFRGDCPRNGKASVTLAVDGKAPAPRPSVKVTEKAGRFVVDTGAALFEVRKNAFNVLDVARVGGEMVIRSHQRGLGVRVEGKEYLASLDSEAEVALEETGTLHVVIRATGSFKNKTGERKCDFDCRIYAYAGSPEFRVTVTLLNRQGREAECIPLSALFLELPTEVKEGSCTFGAEDGGIKRGSLAGSPQAYVYQTSSSEHVFGGAVDGKGGGKQTKPATIGWVGLSDKSKGVALGVKWFWQLHPKSLEFTAAGLARVGLYPARHPKPLNLYAGVARTHEVRLFFHAGSQ